MFRIINFNWFHTCFIVIYFNICIIQRANNLEVETVGKYNIDLHS
jgi:hypothetical protein